MESILCKAFSLASLEAPIDETIRVAFSDNVAVSASLTISESGSVAFEANEHVASERAVTTVEGVGAIGPDGFMFSPEDGEAWDEFLRIISTIRAKLDEKAYK